VAELRLQFVLSVMAAEIGFSGKSLVAIVACVECNGSCKIAFRLLVSSNSTIGCKIGTILVFQFKTGYEMQLTPNASCTVSV
jgi:cell division protein FtsW (lipid II flippase)